MVGTPQDIIDEHTADIRQAQSSGQASNGTPLDAELAVGGWEMIAEGRYQPRRTRGSYVGRVLG
jgi:hypothetical protein